MGIRITSNRQRHAWAVMVLGLLALSVQGQGDSGDSNGLKWTLADDGQSINILGYDGPGGAVTVPDTITAYEGTAEAVALPVRSIAAFAFMNSEVTKVETGNNVTEIGINAFYGCGGLTNVTLGNQLAVIGDYAFSGCDLYGLTIPSSVTNVGAEAFSDCPLTSVRLGTEPAGNANVMTFGYGVFAGCTNLMEVVVASDVTGDGQSVFGPGYGSGANLRTVKIMEGVRCIGDGTFAYCTNLAGVVFPTSLASIGDGTNTDMFSGGYGVRVGAFEGCSGLTNVWLNQYLANVAPGAFEDCDHLKRVIIPDSVTNLGAGAFFSCTGLVQITIGRCVATIGGEAFQNCASLSSLVIPDNVVSIGSQAFLGCKRLAKVAIGKGVADIGDSAFGNDDYGLVGGMMPSQPPIIIPPVIIPPVVIPSNPPTGPFRPPTGPSLPPPVMILHAEVPAAVAPGASLMSTEVVPGPVPTLAAPVLAPVYSLTNITVASGNPFFSSLNGVLFNKQKSFLIQYPYGLKGGYMVPATVRAIGTNAFLGSQYLTSVTIPASVVGLWPNEFSRCPALTNLTVATANAAFSSLNGVLFNKQRTVLMQYPPARRGAYVVPGGVAEIGARAFSECSALTGVTIPAGVKHIGWNAFAYCNGLGHATLPNSVAAIDYGAFQGCGHLQSIGLPANLGRIADFEFMGCTSLSGIVIPGSVTNIGAGAFYNCPRLASITLPGSVNNIAASEFFGCTGLTNVVIPESVTNIETRAFFGCNRLASIIVPASVTNLGTYVFCNCSNLTEVFFRGNAPGLQIARLVPALVYYSEFNNPHTTVYYLPGSSGWGDTLADAPTVMGDPRLTVLVNGLGKVTPDKNGAMVPLGSKATLTAVPARGFKLINWTGGTNQPLPVLTNGPRLQLRMQLNETVQANFAETSRPTLKMATLPARVNATNVSIGVAGTAGDNWRVAGVWCQVNGSGWQLAQTTNQWTNWNATLPLVNGPNTIYVYAMNAGGICSVTNRATVWVGSVARPQLTVTPSGSGSKEGATITVLTPGSVAGYIEYSTDLVHWTRLTNFNSSTGAVSIHDPAATTSPRRFYRTVTP